MVNATKSGPATLRVLGCGGAGVNIASHFEKSEIQDGLADVHVTYVDTSRSNLKHDAPADSVTLIDGVDGSGKVRRENAEAIGESIKRILLDHPPGDMTVVVYSASGGSGSIFGPLIHSELLARDLPVISIIIGSEESALSAENTVNTLKTLDAISQKRDRNVVFAYEHNAPDTPRREVDGHVKTVIASLAILASRQNAELDTKDLQNWLNYANVLGMTPSPVRLRIMDNDTAKEAQDLDVISLASLLTSPDVVHPSWHPDYSATGYCDLGKITQDEREGLHYLLTQDVDKIFGYISDVQSSIEERKSARKEVKRYADRSEADDNGLVL